MRSRKLVSWVMGLGDRARILSPPEVVAEADERLKLVIERHSTGPEIAKAVKRKAAAPAVAADSDSKRETPIRPERFARLVDKLFSTTVIWAVVVFVLVSPFAFFLMALLFLVAGLLTPGSLRRKGAGRYARDRMLRLGVPLQAWAQRGKTACDYHEPKCGPAKCGVIARCSELARTALDDASGGALHVDDRAAVPCAMERRHPLPLAREWHGGNFRKLFQQPIAIEPGLSRRHQQRDLGWVTHGVPSILVAHEHPPELEGSALLHFDVRSDNMCFAGDRTLLVDWNLACRGNPDFDVAFWLPSLRLEGGPEPWEVMPHAGALAREAAGAHGSARRARPTPRPWRGSAGWQTARTRRRGQPSGRPPRCQ